jgi:ssDNA-binding replication factor A large subunit
LQQKKFSDIYKTANLLSNGNSGNNGNGGNSGNNGSNSGNNGNSGNNSSGSSSYSTSPSPTTAIEEKELDSLRTTNSKTYKDISQLAEREGFPLTPQGINFSSLFAAEREGFPLRG